MTKKHVLQLRTALEMDRVGFAEFMGVNRITVWKWETGVLPPNRQAVAFMAFVRKTRGMK